VTNSHHGTIERREEANVSIVVMEGEHDLSTAERLAAALDEACVAAGSVVVDLTNVGFLDSSIVRALLTAREGALREEHGFALIAPPTSFASRVLTLVVGAAIPTYPDLDAAVASVSATR
jgi:anti-sigma B factor antagonist